MSLTEQLAAELGLNPDELRKRLGVITVHYAEPSAAQPNPTIARVKAIAAQQKALRDAGFYDDDVSAYAVMCSADTAATLDRKGRQRDEMINATNRHEFGVGARFTPTRPEG